jgi:putative peptidoglycan lipid II flippase
VLMSWLGTAVIAAVSVPAAHVLAKEPGQMSQLIQGFVLGAPGVAGMAVIANISRVMFALGRLKVAAVGLVASQLLQAVLSVPLVEAVPARLVVGSLALASAVAQLAVAVPMVLVTRRIRGSGAVQGVGRATLASLAAGVVGGVVGVAVSLAVPLGGKLENTVSGALAAAAAVVAFAVVAYLLDRSDLRASAIRLRRYASLHR